MLVLVGVWNLEERIGILLSIRHSDSRWCTLQLNKSEWHGKGPEGYGSTTVLGRAPCCCQDRRVAHQLPQKTQGSPVQSSPRLCIVPPSHPPCKSLWIKASAKCPESKCECKYVLKVSNMPLVNNKKGTCLVRGQRGRAECFDTGDSDDNGAQSSWFYFCCSYLSNSSAFIPSPRAAITVKEAVFTGVVIIIRTTPDPPKKGGLEDPPFMLRHHGGIHSFWICLNIKDNIVNIV